MLKGRAEKRVVRSSRRSPPSDQGVLASLTQQEGIPLVRSRSERCDGYSAGVTDKSGRTSAGILLWRSRDDRLEVLLAHMGGPYWVNKDLGHWTIPKGEVEEGEEVRAVALREFAEETGHELSGTPLTFLGEIRQKSGKLVLAWGARGDLDPATAVSNTFQMEWPPRSGRIESFPEIDRVEWFELDEARRKLKAAQTPFLDRLQAAISADR